MKGVKSNPYINLFKNLANENENLKRNLIKLKRQGVIKAFCDKCGEVVPFEKAEFIDNDNKALCGDCFKK